MDIQIKEGEISQMDEIYILMKEFASFQQTPGKFTLSLEEFKGSGDLFNCLVAVSGKEIVGMASWFFAFYSWSGKAIYLDDLFVKEAFRGRGVGTLLLDELARIAKKSGCKKMRWQVSKWNTSAIAFYRKRGAIIDDVEINCDLLPGFF